VSGGAFVGERQRHQWCLWRGRSRIRTGSQAPYSRLFQNTSVAFAGLSFERSAVRNFDHTAAISKETLSLKFLRYHAY
jgi:hypothetical protein